MKISFFLNHVKWKKKQVWPIFRLFLGQEQVWYLECLIKYNLHEKAKKFLKWDRHPCQPFIRLLFLKTRKLLLHLERDGLPIKHIKLINVRNESWTICRCEHTKLAQKKYRIRSIHGAKSIGILTKYDRFKMWNIWKYNRLLNAM